MAVKIATFYGKKNYCLHECFKCICNRKHLTVGEFISCRLYIIFDSSLEMANKPVLVGIARTRPRFDGESPH